MPSYTLPPEIKTTWESASPDQRRDILLKLFQINEKLVRLRFARPIPIEAPCLDVSDNQRLKLLEVTWIELLS